VKTASGPPGIPGGIVKFAGGIVAGKLVLASDEEDAPIVETRRGVGIARMDKGAAGIGWHRLARSDAFATEAQAGGNNEWPGMAFNGGREQAGDRNGNLFHGWMELWWGYLSGVARPKLI